jgi:D-alanyl-D-alanine carboxypeptidase (penicillin-binding protein 5/6)
MKALLILQKGMRTRMKDSPRRRKHRRRPFRRLFWLLVLATLLLLLWPRRVTLDGLNSPHAILLQADSGEVLAEKDADSTIYPASMTKMMTALLAIEANPDLDTPVTLPEEIFPALQAQNASLAGFRAGETATVICCTGPCCPRGPSAARRWPGR